MVNDKRDVIDWLNDIAEDERWEVYYSEGDCRMLAKDALELLKTQEPIESDTISRSALLKAYDAAHKGPPGGARKLIMEAPAVIAKAKKPRIMTQEEVAKITDHDFIWIEKLTDEMIYHLEVVQVCKSSDGMTTEITLNSPTSLFFITMDKYNVWWRLWTSQPTNEQREEVKWYE